MPSRSPFITPRSEDGRPAGGAWEAPDGARDGEALSSDSAQALALAEQPDLAEVEGPHGSTLIRPARRTPGESPEIIFQRERATARPDDPAAQLSLARTYHAAGIHDLALEHYETARRLSPADPDIVLDLARLWTEAGSPEAALPLLDDVLAARPEDARGWSLRGIALDLLGRLSEGEAALRRAVALAPGRWDYWNNLGYNLLVQDRPEDATAEFERAVALAPAEPALANNLGLALGLAGRPEAAFAAFLRGGREAQAWNNLGVVHRARGQLAAAADAFGKAWRLDPGSRTISANFRESRRRLAAERAAADSAAAAAPGPDLGGRADADPAGSVAAGDSATTGRRLRETQPARVGARTPASPSEGGP